jgi:hypothetical protein
MEGPKLIDPFELGLLEYASRAVAPMGFVVEAVSRLAAVQAPRGVVLRTLLIWLIT